MPSGADGDVVATLVFSRATAYLELAGTTCMLLGATPGMLDLVGVDISRGLGRAAWFVLLAGVVLSAIAVALAYREGRRERDGGGP